MLRRLSAPCAHQMPQRHVPVLGHDELPPVSASSVWVRVVDEVSGAVFEQEITTDLSANTRFLSPQICLNTGTTAAAVAYDCAEVYVETDY